MGKVGLSLRQANEYVVDKMSYDGLMAVKIYGKGMNVVRQKSRRSAETRKRDIFSRTYSLVSAPLKP